MSGNLEVGVKITADSRGLVGESRAAREALGGIGNAAKKSNTESAVAAERFTANLKRQSDTLGFTASQTRAYDAAQLNLNSAQRASVESSNRAIAAFEQKQRVTERLRAGVTALTVAIGVGLVAALKSSINLTTAAEQSSLRLQAVLQGTGHAAGVTKAELDALALSTRGRLGIDDDVLRDSMAVLLTFRNVSRESFGDALEVAADLSKVMQTDLRSAVLQLGKALENPETGLTALSRSGVSFNDMQKEMIKGLVDTGRQTEAITLILRTMKEQGLDKVAESMNSGLIKPSRDAGFAWEDLLKTLGSTSVVRSGIEGFFGSLTSYFRDMRKVIESGDWLDRLAFFTVGFTTPSINALPDFAPVNDLDKTAAKEGLARQQAEEQAAVAAREQKKREEEAAKAAEEASKRAIAAAKARAEASKRAAQQAIEGSQRTIAALKMETEQIGMNVVQKRMMAAAAEAAKAPTAELAQEIMASAQAWALATQQQEALLAAEKDRLQSIAAIERAEKEAARRSVEASRIAAREWNRLGRTVEQTARTTFVQFAAHGTSAMKSIGEAIKLSIIDVLYQLTVRKWIVNIGTSISGLGGAGTAQAGSGGFGLRNAGNIASLASSAFNTGFGATSLLGKGATLLGETFGSAALSSFGSGLAGTGAGVFSAAGGAGTAFIGGAGTAIGGSGLGGAAALGSSFAAVAGPLAIAAAADIAFRALAGDRKLGNFVDNIPVVGSLGALLFGTGKLKQKETNLIGSATAAGFEGITRTKFKAKSGLISGGKTKRIDNDLTLELQTKLDTALQGFALSVAGFANNLGLSAESVVNFSTGINIASEKGKNITDEAIESLLAGIGNQMAAGVFPAIDTLRKAGETAFTTLQRLSSEFDALNNAANVLGLSLPDSRNAISGLPVEQRTAIVDAAGGVDAFNTNIGFIANNFLSDQKKFDLGFESLNEQLNNVGVSADITKDGYYALLQSVDPLNKESVELFNTLSALAPQFIAVNNAAEQLVAQEERLAETSRATAEQLAETARAAANQFVKDQKQLLANNVNDAFGTLQRSVEAERKTIINNFNTGLKTSNDRINTVKQSVGELTSLTNALSAATNEIHPLSTDQARGQIEAAIAAAKSGEFADVADLKNALQVLSKADTSDFSSRSEMQISQARSADLLSQLGTLAGNQLTLEERSLAALVEGQKRLQTGFDNDISRLDSILEQAKMQIDALNGINTSVLSVAAAISGLNLATAQARGTPTITGGSTSIGAINDSVYAASNQAGNPAITDQVINDFVNTPGRTEAEIYKAAIENGVSSSQLAAATSFTKSDIDQWVRNQGLPGFASGGNYPGGLAVFGERGPELVDMAPARVFSNGDSRKMLDFSGVVIELQLVRKELEAIRGHTNDAAKNTQDTASLLDNVTAGGGPMLVEMVS